MTTIQVLGTGCKKCRLLKENAEAAVQKCGMEAQVEKIEDINEIVKFGVMTTPALAIDGQVKFVGKVASAEEIAALLGR
jgi:small redox-active disulfide protein 2